MSDENCGCQKTFDFVPSSITDAFGTVYESNTINVDFGKVQVGLKKWLKFPINRTQNENIFNITRDPETNPIYQVFGFNKYKIKEQDTYLKVFYLPVFAQTINIDYFDITDSYNNVTRVCVTGEGVGPEVRASRDFLKFHVFGDRKVCKHTVELKNDSEVEAQFSMEGCDAFNVDKTSGTIAGNGYVYVNITYIPKALGTHVQNLECLVLHQQPLIIKLLGICSENDVIQEQMIDYPDVTSPGSFNKYMGDIQTCLESFPLVSLSENYLDFGAVQCLNDEVKKISKTMVTSLTNHGAYFITIQWESSNDDNFDIFPKSLEIPGDESALFEVVFKPDKPDNVYSRTLIGNVHWKDGGDAILHIPIPITLRLTGHSFAENTYWIPQLEIEPEVSILPPALPGYPSFQTFLLKTKGHLPVLYKFLPPKKSNFIVKPAMGLVQGFQVMVVQLCTEVQSNNKNGKIYVEQWCLQLNGQKTHKIPFYLKGFAERPKMMIGDENVVKFTAIQSGCMQKQLVPIRNKSQHYLKYEFLISTEKLEIPDANGELAPNERKLIEWSYKTTGSELTIHTITCKCYAMEKMKAIQGEPVEIDVSVYTDSSFSELCSIPNSFNLGLVECHSQHSTKFVLRNFGFSVIHFSLIAKDHNGNIHKDICLMPSRGSLEPDGELSINVHYVVENTGRHLVRVYYLLRMWENCCSSHLDYEKLIFSLTCQSSYPVVQIVDIANHDFGPLFTKSTLWELMNIDELNKILRTIKKNEKAAILLEVPEVELGSDTLKAIFMFRNESVFPTELCLKRKQLCHCELQKIEDSISVRKLRFKCPHREVLHLDMDEGAIEVKTSFSAKSVQTLHMKARYYLQGTTHLSYDLFLAHNRCIQLDFKVTAVADYALIASRYDLSYCVMFDDVCLSEFDPCTQCFWLYNNANKIVEHSLETISLDMINIDYGFNVLSCLNPTGEIMSYSSKPLIFTIKPIELRTINLCLPLNLGEERIYLRFSSTGKSVFINKEKSKIFAPLTVYNEEVPITLSQDKLILDPFPVWSYVTRMIFIRNMTKNRIIGYSWNNCKLDGIVDIKVNCRKGVLKPRESKSVIIQVKSFGRPCKTRLQLPCKLLDHSLYYKHRKTTQDYNARQEEINLEFTITENGTSFPINEIEIFPCPKQFYVGIAIDVTITSIHDRDLHYTPIQQMQQSPHSHLDYHLDSVVFKCVSNLEHDVDKPIKSRIISLRDMETQMSKTVDVSLQSTESDTTQESESAGIDLLEKTMECIMGDVIFSELFKEFLGMYKRKSILYYEQIKNNQERDYERLAKELYTDPQLDEISQVLSEVMTDSLHDMFQLGPQGKTSPDMEKLAKELEINYEKELTVEQKTCTCHK
ncbi:PREDICTED: coiled-coil domain-containing protein 108 [Nicrophorus vespilloides]|uniref:Coiled-coil domain-containing protein 108 n=1 Tax=Nicrophorus vespilloides TaxID=110193 RepID=A0ABM1M451_NICVS|nr:PREDICTED: coiled-coil domain-containing protein 108 [Nicrophorus vespilloides]